MEFFLREKDEKIAELNKELSINDKIIEFLFKTAIADLNKLECKLQEYREETKRLESCIKNYNDEAINKENRIEELENTIRTLLK